MAELKNSRRINYKATYNQISPAAALRADGAGTKPTKSLMRAIEKTAFVQALRIIPEELSALKGILSGTVGRPAAPASNLPVALEAIQKLIADKTSLSTLNGANTLPVAALTLFLDGSIVINGSNYNGINGYNTDTNNRQLALDPTTPEEGLLPTYAAVPSDDVVWNNPYFYKCPGDTGDYDLICFGADGLPGGTDKNADISASSEASLISTWYEYTPLNALDIGVTTHAPGSVSAQPSQDIG